jgi:hypothetical protein
MIEKCITVIYDPDEGYVCPDNYVKFFVDLALASKQEQFVLGSEPLVNEFRLRVSRGEVDYRRIQFKFKDETITVNNRFAGLSHWPEGFIDITLKQMAEISSIRRKGNTAFVKEEKNASRNG